MHFYVNVGLGVGWDGMELDWMESVVVCSLDRGSSRVVIIIRYLEEYITNDILIQVVKTSHSGISCWKGNTNLVQYKHTISKRTTDLIRNLSDRSLVLLFAWRKKSNKQSIKSLCCVFV